MVNSVTTTIVADISQVNKFIAFDSFLRKFYYAISSLDTVDSGSYEVAVMVSDSSQVLITTTHTFNVLVLDPNYEVVIYGGFES